MSDEILRVENITKKFPGVTALDNVNFDLRRGEVHLLLGENGAGKSTLIKILTGAHPMDSGQILLHGQTVRIRDPHHAQRLGIAAIYQELNLVPELTVSENIFLGREPRQLAGLHLNQAAIHRRSREWLETLGITLDPGRRVKELGVSLQQMVEVAKALSQEAKILIMDEPTSALTESEIERLFDVIRRLKRAGVSIIYISHRLREITQIGDRATVLRNGRNVGTVEMEHTSIPRLITMMVGKTLEERLQRERLVPGEEVLRVEHLSYAPLLKDISFTLRRREILGIAGAMGTGRSELAQAIFGAVKRHSGSIYISNKPVNLTGPRQAIKSGVAFLPEDRKNLGLILGMSVAANISLASLRKMARGGVIDLNTERRTAMGFIKTLQIKTPGIQQKVRFLSGGTQQKVVLAKWLFTKSQVFIFDEPTRGIDVEAKGEIYSLIDELARQGAGIILISSDLPELIGLADRIIVLRDGHIVHELPRDTATEELVLHHVVGEGE
ncbi:MAG: sugar ABC transporter ATP-binding protein [Ardenticatenaceae bacterium]|nr:sugar ABC transporter ATP-binding protein [Ardenticatenaceae bacterium]